MKNIFVIVLLFLSYILTAQNINFNQVLPSSSITAYFEGVNTSKIIFVDVDNDNDLDVLIAGKKNNDYYGISEHIGLYINDGNGNFHKNLLQSFPLLTYPNFIFGDVDGDNDLDLLLTGEQNQVKRTFLLLNDGNGNLTIDTTNSFEGYAHNDMAFHDFDNDGDIDLVISGKTESFRNKTVLYINNGSGLFIESTSHNFMGLFYSTVLFEDLDGDGIKDLFFHGKDNNHDYFTKIYKIDANGLFQDITPSSLHTTYFSHAVLIDIDNDNDLDLVTTKETSDSEVFLNDGNANFTSNGTAGITSQGGNICPININNDGAIDLLITGDSNTETKLFINNGSGLFNETPTNGMWDVSKSFAAVADINGDSYDDIIISGRNAGYDVFSTTNLYLNNQDLTFNRINVSDLPYICNGATDLADIDNDNDVDILMAGITLTNNPYRRLYLTKLYENTGVFSFSDMQISNFPQVKNTDVKMIDIDNDNDMDVFVSGYNDFQGSYYSRLYYNNGNSAFSYNTNNNFVQVSESSVSFGDVNNDNLEDILITGENSNTYFSKLYIQNAGGGFQNALEMSFAGVFQSSVILADFNNSGQDSGPQGIDLVITGDTDSYYHPISKLYINDGYGYFLEDTSSNIVAVGLSAVAHADIDGDGDQDLLVTGLQPGNTTPVSKLYLNDGNAHFTDSQIALPGISRGSVVFADFDFDNDQDLFMMGLTQQGNRIAKMYENDGTGHFTEVLQNKFIPLMNGDISVADIDGDNDLDMLLTGYDGSSPISVFYENTSTIAGIDKLNNDELSFIYPNPVENSFVLQLPKQYLYNVYLYNLKGQVVKAFTKIKANKPIKVNLPTGIYISKVTSVNKQISRINKMIVK